MKRTSMSAVLAILALSGYAAAAGGGDLPERAPTLPDPRTRDRQAERKAAAEAKRAKRQAKRLRNMGAKVRVD